MFYSNLNVLFRSDRDQDEVRWSKIPWDDPDFSRRMLREHLTQDHDKASRRAHIIDQHVAWMHQTLLQEMPSTVLDLGCGPGFYTGRLSALGHTCTGIDFSPASIDYARSHYAGAYVQGDLRTVPFGEDFDLVYMIFGEFNAFSPADAQAIIDKAFTALNPGGRLLLEVTHDVVIEKTGTAPPGWYKAEKGLFSDAPFVCLMENEFRDRRAVTHFYVIDAATGATALYANALQAYSEQEYRAMLGKFADISVLPCLPGTPEPSDNFVLLASKAFC